MSVTPSPQLVGQAFLQSRFPSWGVTTTLPKLTTDTGKDNWSGKTQWVTVSQAGIGSHFTVPVRRPIVQVHVWGQNRDRAFWGKTSAVAQDIISQGTDWYTNVRLSVPYPGYRDIELSSFTPRSDANPIENDPQGLAHFVIDVELTYSVLL